MQILLFNLVSFVRNLSVRERIIGILIFIVAFLAINLKCQRDQIATLKEETIRQAQNVRALTDTIRVTKAKNGAVEYNKYVLLAKDNEDLKKLNATLAEEVKNTKGKVKVIQKTDYVVVHEPTTVYVDRPIVKDGVVVINGQFDTTYSVGNYRYFKTETLFNLKDSSATQKILNDELGFTAITGLKENADGNYEIFVRPKYPKMTVTGLEGAIIDKNFFKQSKATTPKITVGGHIGWTPITYDLQSKKGGFNLYQLGAGLGIHFNF